MDVVHSRRGFLQQTAAFTMAGGLPTSPAADDPAPMPIVDTHQHLWDLSRFRLPWLKSAPRLDRSYLTTDYRQATEGLNIVKSVYMEVDVEPSQQIAEADYVLELIGNGESPLVAAVIARRPGSEGFAEFVDRYSDRAT